MNISSLRFGFLPAAVAATWLPLVAFATDTIWTNSGFISVAPQIDAVSFFNDGYMGFGSLNPFETSNTRNYTNAGIMVSAPGWFFHTASPGNGERRMADNFVNLTTGSVEAQDSGGVIIIGVGGTVVAPSYLWVTASNIVNKGVLTVGANGWMKLVGDSVTLNRSGLEVRAITPIGSANDFQLGQFIPDAGIHDVWWGGTNVANPPGINSAAIWSAAQGGTATTPSHDITRYPNGQGRTAFRVINAIADSYAETNAGIFLTLTNVVGITNITGPTITNVDMTNIVVTNIFIPTNITRQAVFVGVADPSRQLVAVTWFNSTSPTNFFKAPQIEISTVSTNVVEDRQELNSLYFLDTLASTTNRGLLANAASFANLTSYRPASYILSRLPIMGGGFTGNGTPDTSFFFERNVFTNAVVAVDYAAYSAFIDYLPSEVPTIPAGTVTNLPGRIQVYADSLDMRKARIRGQGEVILKVDHLVGSSNAVVDSPHLSFTLTSTNNNLNVIDLTKEEVARTKGPMRFWSGVWENQATYISDNWQIITNLDTNGAVVSIDLTNAPVTNTAVVGLYALIVDAQNLQPTLPVTVWDFVTHSKNVVVNDNMTVVQSFFTDAEDFTLNSRLSLSNAFWTTSIGTVFFAAVPDWIHTNAPNLVNFTNTGFLWVPNDAHFGDDRLAPYHNFVNRGTVDVWSVSVKSDYFQNSGTMQAGLSVRFLGGTGNFDNGTINARSTLVSADNLRMNRSRINALDLTLEVPGVLADSGVSASNVVTVLNGFSLLRRPASGDLLGTTFRTSLPDFQQIDHTWNSADRGATAAGYSNNAALGSLAIDFAAYGKDPLAFFRGAQPGSALYVDYLDIYALSTNWDQLIEIDPSLVIYYAAVRANFTPPTLPNGIPQSPEEYLDGQFGGRLRWVRDYAGARSTVPVLVDGVTVYVNAALRNSKSIDSDNDGTPNYYDSTPLGGSSPSGYTGITLSPSLISTNVVPKGKAFSITWTAAPNTAYQVEVASDLVRGDWQPFAQYTNNATTSRTATISDIDTPSVSQRFFRVRAK